MKKRTIVLLAVLFLLILFLTVAAIHGGMDHNCCQNCHICAITKELKDLMTFAVLLTFAIATEKGLCACRIAYSEENGKTLLSSTPIKLKVKLSN